jgi:flagellar motor switch protein FliG
MIANTQRPANIIPGIRKAAITLVALGDQTSAEIFKLLEEDEVELLGKEISRLTAVTSEQAESVMEEFHQMSLAHEYMMKGGVDYAKRVLNTAFGPEAARKIIDRLVKSLGSDVATFDSLQKADPTQVAKFIQNEHPQTIALVLSHLNASSAASMLLALPPEIRTDVSMRMANLEQISPEIVSKIATIVDQKLKALGEFSRESYGGIRAVAELFNRLDSNASREILEQIEETDPALGEGIRNLMFVFEDLLLIDAQGMREILSRVDKKSLTLALKGTSEQLREHFFQNMSERGAEMLREDMEAMGAVKIREVEQAQQAIISVVRQLESEGVLSLKGQVGEQYVV